MLVVRELKVRYKRSVFGLLWTMLNPLLLMIVYTVVFTTIMPVAQRNFSIFLLAALLPWLFFSTAVLQGLNSILGNQELIRKVRVPQAVFPLSVVGSNLVNFTLSMLPLFLLMAALKQRFSTALFFVPVGMILLTIFTSGVTLLLATFTVFFRDVRHLAEVLLQMMMYLSPVLYDLNMLGANKNWWFRFFQWFLAVNPITYLLALIREPVYYARVPDAATIAIATGSSFVALAVGYKVFQRLAPRHIHYL
ncbi:MAG: ABC transporter permease [Myxococcales bacterium]|nr:ABC transporter permease [Myxococcales bacterium]